MSIHGGKVNNVAKEAFRKHADRAGVYIPRSVI
jgi:hypothetical protein